MWMSRCSAPCRPEFTKCVLVTFHWAGVPQALHVLREMGSDTTSGAVVARHLGSLPLAASASHTERYRWDRWVSFARKWHRRDSSESSWLGKSAEVGLLMEHGAILPTKKAPGNKRLLQVQVISVNATLEVSACLCLAASLLQIPHACM